MKICGIYKITNKVTGKIYIGQSVNIKDRKYKHRWASNNIYAKDHNTDLHTDYRVFGIDNFDFEIIEECPREKLDEREIYWITYYDSYKNGYNQTSGGNIPSSVHLGEDNGRAQLNEKDIIQIRTALLTKKYTPIEYYKKYFQDKISQTQFIRIWRGESWISVFPEAIAYVQSDQYTKDQLMLKRKRNLEAEQIKNNDKQSKINFKSEILEKKKTYNYNEVYNIYKEKCSKDEFDTIWFHGKRPNMQKVLKLDKNTLIILDTYDSISEAASCNNCDPSGITKVCRGKKNSAGGFKWKYAESVCRRKRPTD